VAALLDYAAQISAEQGVSPLEFLLSVMRDIANPLELRIDAAKAAAPYVHPRLAQIQRAHSDGTALKDNQVVFLGACSRQPCQLRCRRNMTLRFGSTGL
jgi:hypothetical protein